LRVSPLFGMLEGSPLKSPRPTLRTPTYRALRLLKSGRTLKDYDRPQPVPRLSVLSGSARAHAPLRGASRLANSIGLPIYRSPSLRSLQENSDRSIFCPLSLALSRLVPLARRKPEELGKIRGKVAPRPSQRSAQKSVSAVTTRRARPRRRIAYATKRPASPCATISRAAPSSPGSAAHSAGSAPSRRRSSSTGKSGRHARTMAAARRQICTAMLAWALRSTGR